MNQALKQFMTYAINKYANEENICTLDEFEKRESKCVAETSISISNPNDLRVRTAITGLGRILQQDPNAHTYITTIKVGSGCAVNEALAVTVLNNEVLSIVACAHEGLITQHIAEKAVESIVTRITQLAAHE